VTKQFSAPRKGCSVKLKVSVPDPCRYLPDLQSAPLDYGFGSSPFFSCLQGDNKKSFFSYLFYLLLTVGTFTLVFKDNKLLRSNNTVEIRIEGSGSAKPIKLTDLDPEY
jgi:hypothetical protein